MPLHFLYNYVGNVKILLLRTTNGIVERKRVKKTCNYKNSNFKCHYRFELNSDGKEKVNIANEVHSPQWMRDENCDIIFN